MTTGSSRLSPALLTLSCLFIFLSGLYAGQGRAQSKRTALATPAEMVNIFLGTSGDHGQMSPAASYPFSMLSIGPQTYPNLHAGYEYFAKKYLGFTHTRFEGVGCQGSGGNILIKPFLGQSPEKDVLIKREQHASPGYFSASFTNGIEASMVVSDKAGLHQYKLPSGPKGFYIDLSHTLANSFVAEEHVIVGSEVSGWIEAKTTCNAGKYRLYYLLQFSEDVTIEPYADHKLLVRLPNTAIESEIRVALSSVSTQYARLALTTESFDRMKHQSGNQWSDLLSRVKVKGDPDRQRLFYSLLYRTMQSPYLISERDGSYRAVDGSLRKTNSEAYNGWAIWDNYRTQLPLLSVVFPDKYGSIVSSVADLYRFGKRDYATQNEPSNTVRTEHAIVVLLDAYRKGYRVDFPGVLDSLIAEVNRLDFSRPDKALESSYDTWALSEILKIENRDELSKEYRARALDYRKYWVKDFKDIKKSDVDRMQARGLYQGTIWQYRWFVPFDVKGLIDLIGGEKEYIRQLDEFFDKDYYNHANEPDIQVPLMYNASSEPWKSQHLMHKYAVDTVIQYYFNDNSRGIDPFVDVIYKNEPKAYIRTMDDDAGAMSAWFIFAACGFSPACVGWPIYYLNVPLFESVEINWPGKKPFQIITQNYSQNNRYIKKVTLNGRTLNRNYLTHEEITAGGRLVITASDQPQPRELTDTWVTEVK